MPQSSAQLRRPAGVSGPPRDPARDALILRAATELLAEGGYTALTMDKAAARAGVGKATVYRRWPSRAELAAEALDHAGLTDDVIPVTDGSGSGIERVREELTATLVSALGDEDASRVDLVSALLDTARQEPELCSLIRKRYVDSLHRAVAGVLEHALQRGDLRPRSSENSHQIAVSAAIALLVHWGIVHDQPVNRDDVAQIVNSVLIPLLS
ncbi:TetR/AcrR family transcriptional regulator [Microbacterium terricola]|uniref:TetR-family transcriptional regulator n=1 Tax=Microbacterium terricola TaxID=344163 RepID=A0ABM8E174_9MICO|nr:TetR/AcrR family transcriptional regulator [Microbacterium terricola]UYK40695.1 TetR/AcrR family transcriptional regulator [Microbacterium terricola]BDV31569.1 putative TetR-family transcriptional regulator [Microbacterium terricola]